ncbi:MAG TPA: hypothetical protein VKE40_06380 [Gemmataceae bacterium]|nr:hypothetical protein [Gemmataceae bacterium]
MRSMFLSAAACLFAATTALAQPPVATLPPTGLPMVSGPVQPVGATSAVGSCFTGKCGHGAPCTPEFKPGKKTVYSTVTRDICLPSRSFCDILLKKCCLSDDCESAPTGETRTKTLLVKKLVPNCDEGCCAGHK